MVELVGVLHKGIHRSPPDEGCETAHPALMASPGSANPVREMLSEFHKVFLL
jgi:hypothetical protein